MTHLWEILTSAEWVANVGIPMFLSVIALAVAVVLVRQQMRNDATLMQRGLMRERALTEVAEFCDFLDEVANAVYDYKPERLRQLNEQLITAASGAYGVLRVRFPDWYEVVSYADSLVSELVPAAIDVSSRMETARESGLQHSMAEMLMKCVAEVDIDTLAALTAELQGWDGEATVEDDWWDKHPAVVKPARLPQTIKFMDQLIEVAKHAGGRQRAIQSELRRLQP